MYVLVLASYSLVFPMATLFSYEFLDFLDSLDSLDSLEFLDLLEFTNFYFIDLFAQLAKETALTTNWDSLTTAVYCTS